MKNNDKRPMKRLSEKKEEVRGKRSCIAKINDSQWPASDKEDFWERFFFFLLLFLLRAKSKCTLGAKQTLVKLVSLLGNLINCLQFTLFFGFLHLELYFTKFRMLFHYIVYNLLDVFAKCFINLFFKH